MYVACCGIFLVINKRGDFFREKLLKKLFFNYFRTVQKIGACILVDSARSYDICVF